MGEEKTMGRKVQRTLGESVTTKIKPTSVRKTGLFSKMHAMSLKLKKAESVASVESEESAKDTEKENGNSATTNANASATTNANASANTSANTTTPTPSTNSSNTSKPPTLSSLSQSLRRTRSEEDEEEKKKREERRRLFCSRLKAAPEEDEIKPKPMEKGIKRFFRSNSSKSQPFSTC